MVIFAEILAKLEPQWYTKRLHAKNGKVGMCVNWKKA